MNQSAVLRTAREAAGVSLRELARMIHYSASYLSMAESDKRAVPQRLVSAYESALGVDLHRLTAVNEAPSRVDSAALTQIAEMLSALRHLEDRIGVHPVTPAIQGLTNTAERLADAAPSRLCRLAGGLAGELNQYRGYLEHVSGAVDLARRSFRRAAMLAVDTDDPDRKVHAFSFHAWVNIENGDLHAAAELTEASLDITNAHPLIRVYDLYQKARICVLNGENQRAQRALCYADKAAEAAADHTAPACGYWYTPGLWGLHRGRVLITLGQRDRGRREIETGLGAMPAEHRNAHWATAWVRSALDE